MRRPIWAGSPSRIISRSLFRSYTNVIRILYKCSDLVQMFESCLNAPLICFWIRRQKESASKLSLKCQKQNATSRRFNGHHGKRIPKACSRQTSLSLGLSCELLQHHRVVFLPREHQESARQCLDFIFINPCLPKWWSKQWSPLPSFIPPRHRFIWPMTRNQLDTLCLY